RCYTLRGDLLFADLHTDQFKPFTRQQFSDTWDKNEENIAALLGKALEVKTEPKTKAPKRPEQPSWLPERKDAAPAPTPAPAPRAIAQWTKIYTWDRTFLGSLPLGKLGAVSMRGKWVPYVLPPNGQCEQQAKDVSDYNPLIGPSIGAPPGGGQ